MMVPPQERDLLQIPISLLVNSIRAVTFIASPSEAFEEWDSWSPISAPIDLGDLPPATPGSYEQYLLAAFAAVQRRLTGSRLYSFARLEASQREKLLEILSSDDVFRDVRFADPKTRTVLSIRLVQTICLAPFHPEFEERLALAIKQMNVMVVHYAKMCDFFYEQMRPSTRRSRSQATPTASVPSLGKQPMSSSLAEGPQPSQTAIFFGQLEERARPLPHLSVGSPRKSEAPSYLSTTLPRPEGLVPLQGRPPRPEDQRGQPLIQTIPAEIAGARPAPILQRAVNRPIVPDQPRARPSRVLYRVHRR
jgi:hypothetical protein